MVLHPCSNIGFSFLLSVSILLSTATARTGNDDKGNPTMSSEYSSSYSAEKCMDKKMNTNCHNKRGGDEKPYFMIEYSTPVMVNQVRLIASKIYWHSQLTKNVMVIVTNDTKSSGTQFGPIFKGPAIQGEVINFQPETGIMGKYVLVKKQDKGVITFAEVEVNPESLGLRCNGMNEGCCTTDNPCENGDGDCDSDSQCEGDLICGNDNCLWKDGDDCCKKNLPRPGNPTMSSYQSSRYSAEKCMDNNMNTYCFSKWGGDEKPFFMIEYSTPVMVNQVRLIASQSYPHYAKNIMVIVTNDTESSGTQFGSIFKGPATKSEDVINFQPETGIMGKYVIVKKQDKGVITFTEVEVNPGLLRRQQNIVTNAWPNCMAGWYDVQGQGVNNDYCRWVGNCGCRNSLGGDCSYWSCALAGSNSQNTKKGEYSEEDTVK